MVTKILAKTRKEMKEAACVTYEGEVDVRAVVGTSRRPVLNMT